MTENKLAVAGIKLFVLRTRQQILQCLLSNEKNVIALINVIQACMPNYFAADEEFLRAERGEARFNEKSISLELDRINAEIAQAQKDNPRPCEPPFPPEAQT